MHSPAMKRIEALTTSLTGSFLAPADKSIGHRAAILLALSHGEASIENFPGAEDCYSTLRSLRTLGVAIEERGALIIIHGEGRGALRSPSTLVDCGNSGTTARFLSGVIASTPGLRATLDGDASLRKRPMARVAKPLRQMGAVFQSETLPMTIEGASAKGIAWLDEKSSAQVKSAILLAGLAASGETTYQSPLSSRDHTERMLSYLGASLSTQDNKITITPSSLTARPMTIPGDPSGAAFFLGAALICPGSRVSAREVCVNPTRMGLYRALQRMNANLSWVVTREQCGEPIGSISAAFSSLQGTKIERAEVPSLIDELPLLAVLATQATGETLVEGAEELRVKESDRIAAICQNLQRMGANIEPRPDGFRVIGPTRLQGASIESFGDHRIAMAMSVAALIAEGGSALDDESIVSISYPAFFEELATLVG
jgi:3-phosphoshikimate 1-carboxyvinyltransferase